MKHGLSETCHLFFSTLANPARLAILELLRNGSKNVTEIAEGLNQEQSMISHNLQLLYNCGFVFPERRKKERFYSLNKETLEPLFKIFLYHAEKYCPTKGKCLTQNGLRRKRKMAAASPMCLSHQ
ncbi:MAG: winged helix-turn-helix transcriptional regulator [Candidatus Bathyarchaeota archaeon]|nr:MAG: winged helix-turn-helix transcriptional regulator [Candidatus Bathyarchaeota archaeon]